MACPFFVPMDPLGQDRWLRAPRFPLGEAYRGVCEAGGERFEPPESSQEELCNCGYARGKCEKFPEDAPDAVRFSVVDENDLRIRLIFVLERAHAPESHGVLEFLKGPGRFEGAAGRLEAQAAAFVKNHLR